MAQAIEDLNGWVEISENKLSRPGVFEYLGREILGAPEPDKIYKVLRPVEELADPECAKSFRLNPWIIGHEMLGEKYAVDPAVKGIHGVTGESIFYDEDDGWLKGNIKLFTQDLEHAISNGMEDLSLGYSCEYEFKPGVTTEDMPGFPAGTAYDVIQRKIRGNHLASVTESRMGVAVMDSVAMDSMTVHIYKDNGTMKTKPGAKTTAQDQETTPKDAAKVIADMMPIMKQLADLAAVFTSFGDPKEPIEEKTEETDEKTEEKTTVEDEETTDEDKKEEANSMDEKIQSAIDSAVKKAVKLATDPLNAEIKALKEDNAAMDSRIMQDIVKRDDLASRLAPHLSTAIDHKSLKLSELAEHGAKALGLDCAPGQELAVLNAYLHNRKVSPKLYTVGAKSEDGKTVSNPIDQLLS